MTNKTLPEQAESLAKKSHPSSLPAYGAQTWRQLRSDEARSRRGRNWRVAVIVAVLAAVYALAAHLYAGVGR